MGLDDSWSQMARAWWPAGVTPNSTDPLTSSSNSAAPVCLGTHPTGSALDMNPRPPEDTDACSILVCHMNTCVPPKRVLKGVGCVLTGPCECQARHGQQLLVGSECGESPC